MIAILLFDKYLMLRSTPPSPKVGPLTLLKGDLNLTYCTVQFRPVSLPAPCKSPVPPQFFIQ